MIRTVVSYYRESKNFKVSRIRPQPLRTTRQFLKSATERKVGKVYRFATQPAARIGYWTILEKLKDSSSQRYESVDENENPWVLKETSFDLMTIPHPGQNRPTRINDKYVAGESPCVTDDLQFPPLEGIWSIDLTKRRLHSEMMDQPNVDPQELKIALLALDRYNRLSFTHGSFWRYIQRMAKSHLTRQLRVLDVACGGGDLAVKLTRTAERSKLMVTVDGCDLSSVAIAIANEKAKLSRVRSQFFQFDVVNDLWPTDYDIIISSLFLHHLPTPMAELVLQRMAESTRSMVIINDLIRSRVGYIILRMGTLLTTRSKLARYDGPVSVAGAFTLNEMSLMATNAGLLGNRVHRGLPERMLLVWNKM